MKLSELRMLVQMLPAAGDDMDQSRRSNFLKSLGLEPGEIYQELEMESRFADCHRDTSFANSQVNLHSHSFYELLCCCNTCGAEYLVGSDRYRLQKGDIILIAPGVSHRPLLPESITEPYRRDILWISTEFMENLKTVFGMTPVGSGCVTQRRLIAAKSLIQEGAALEAVAERTGFSDYSSFYRAFKKEYGISPRQYRGLQDAGGNFNGHRSSGGRL